MKNNAHQCPMLASMGLLGGKWKLILINRIHRDSPARFGELKRNIPGISQSMLTSQLRELEESGLIARKIFAEMPPRVEYTLTELGHSLEPVVLALCTWGLTHASGRPVGAPMAMVEVEG